MIVSQMRVLGQKKLQGGGAKTKQIQSYHFVNKFFFKEMYVIFSQLIIVELYILFLVYSSHDNIIIK